MIKKLKSITLGLAAFAMLLAPALVATAPALAGSPNIQNSLCEGSEFKINAGSGGGNCSGQTGTTSLNNLLTQAVNIFSAIVGVIAVIMIIVGGLKYITSGGDSSKVGAAKNTLIYAIIGLVIVALAQVIVHFVLQKASDL